LDAVYNSIALISVYTLDAVY